MVKQPKKSSKGNAQRSTQQGPRLEDGVSDRGGRDRHNVKTSKRRRQVYDEDEDTTKSGSDNAEIRSSTRRKAGESRRHRRASSAEVNVDSEGEEVYSGLVRSGRLKLGEPSHLSYKKTRTLPASSPLLPSRQRERFSPTEIETRSSPGPMTMTQRRRLQKTIDSDSDGDEPRPKLVVEENPGLLWANTKARPHGESTSSHQVMVELCKAMTVSRVLTGAGLRGGDCSAWLDHDECEYSDLIEECWLNIRKKKEKFMQLDVCSQIEKVPKNFEARRIKDALSDYRTKTMSTTRTVALDHYKWGYNAQEVKDKVAGLLKDNAFTCRDWDKRPGERPFTAPAIIMVIARQFCSRAKSGLARQPGCREYFFPTMSARLVVFITTCVWWAIKEYESGAKSTANFEGPEVDRKYHAFWRLFDGMSETRQQMTLAKVGKCVTDAMKFYAGGNDDEDMEEDIIDRFKDGVADYEDDSDLEELSMKLQPRHPSRDSGYLSTVSSSTPSTTQPNNSHRKSFEQNRDSPLAQPTPSRQTHEGGADVPEVQQEEEATPEEEYTLVWFGDRRTEHSLSHNASWEDLCGAVGVETDQMIWVREQEECATSAGEVIVSSADDYNTKILPLARRNRVVFLRPWTNADEVAPSEEEDESTGTWASRAYPQGKAGKLANEHEKVPQRRGRSGYNP